MNYEDLEQIRDECKNDDCVVGVLFDIIQDLESRTCENCKWFDKFDGYKGLCQKIGPVHEVPKDFGCNQFEAKTVSTDTKSPQQD